MNENYKPQKIAAKELNRFIKNRTDLLIEDHYDSFKKSLYQLRNPSLRFDPNAGKKIQNILNKKSYKHDSSGSWFYFSWLNTLVHYLSESEHQELRTGRNKNLISEEEQKKYYNSSIAILGMSVGSHIASTIVMTGGSKRITLADPDVLSGDNLNRIRCGFQNVGINKGVKVSRELYEINPYSQITLYENGLNEENLSSIIQNHNLIIDEMDNPYWKIKIREEAQKNGVPIIMGTDNGDGIILDVERFDKNKNYPILHGLVKSLTSKDLKQMNPRDIPKLAAKIAGANIASIKMLNSVSQVGKTLYSWPQLGTAATLCGAALAYVGRRIVLKDNKIKSGRYEVNLDSIFEWGYNTKAATLERKKNRTKFIKSLNN